jgi:DNA modification methylase
MPAFAFEVRTVSMKWRNLFGDEIDEFVEAKERYGIWPTTVWVCNAQDKDKMLLKEIIGDDGEVRAGSLQSVAKPNSKSCYQVSAGVFNPAVAAWCLNFYAPRTGLCFDPFAGGGTRAVMASKHGLNYLGLELREAECAAIRKRCQRNDAEGVMIHQCDAQRCDFVPDESADFTLTCPPYFDLEKYDGGPDDLSMAPSYMHFCAMLSKVLRHNYRVLKPDTTACWIVGLHRDKHGELIPLNHDVTRLAKAAGFKLKEEVVLHTINNGSIQRVGNFEKGNKLLIRTHEYVLVLRKGAIG